jgi:hypothetical protein
MILYGLYCWKYELDGLFGSDQMMRLRLRNNAFQSQG